MTKTPPVVTSLSLALLVVLVAACTANPASAPPENVVVQRPCPAAATDELVVATGPAECLLGRSQWAEGTAKAEARSEDLVDTTVPVGELCPTFVLLDRSGATDQRTSLAVVGGPLANPALCCHLERLEVEGAPDAGLVRVVGQQDARECLGGTAHPFMSALYRLDREGSTLRLVTDDSKADIPGPGEGPEAH